MFQYRPLPEEHSVITVPNLHAGSTTHTCFAKPSVLDLLPPAHATYLRHVYSHAVSDLDMHLRMLSSGTGHLVHAD